ncbi:DUF726 domain-containing protein [Specibacter sp. NPDC078709]|uniref:DUF726 domain-containing protein n=1 Tax=Specibacter sp. NPDC078709 TaxID=3154364 RepID=UPI0034194665
MQKSNVMARVLDGNRLECHIVSPKGQELTLSGLTTDVEPQVGAGMLGANRLLMNHAWIFAKAKFDAVNLPDEEQQKSATARAKKHRKLAEWIADIAEDVTDVKKHAWCSACFGQHNHSKVNVSVTQLNTFVCDGCGAPGSPCMGPVCQNMAVRVPGAVQVNPYCAEHSHRITGFEKADRKMGALNNYEEFLKYDKQNLSRTTKVVGLAGLGIAAATPIAFFAAPAIGGAVGAAIGGYTGAAATSYGLALLGGGSLAAGGLGMAGGTLVVTAVGSALGGVLGASVVNAYVSEDKSFHIEMLQGGTGVPVIVCSGFLNEGGKGWGGWHNVITGRYSDSPVYRVHWGSKELKHLGLLAGGGAAQGLGMAAIKEAALKAAKVAGRKLGPIVPALVATDVAKNPWSVARNRAEKTGAIVADLLARTDAESYVLVGHSLGARAMIIAAETLATKPGAPKIQAAHFLGAAVGAKRDCHVLSATVEDAVYNYHSNNDSVLKYAYPIVEAGKEAAGRVGFIPGTDKVQNIDVSTMVKEHSDYLKTVSLR